MPSNGKPTKPTIKVGLNEPTGVAVDSKGKIYVSNAFTSNVTTYKSNGQQTTPTSHTAPGILKRLGRPMAKRSPSAAISLRQPRSVVRTSASWRLTAPTAAC